LLAYLAYKTISRANFQLEHLEITNCEGDTERLLEMMEKDIELAENNLNKPPREPNATELLQMLKKKIE
jgi:HEPN domain-containing protein